MALIIFKYCLPILLGYTLFVGISGRYVPFMRPRELARRPSWFLGLWTGISVAAIVSFGLGLAYQIDLGDVSKLFAPGAKMLGAAMLPGVLLYLWYRIRITQQINAVDDEFMTAQSEQVNENEYDETMVLDTMANFEMDDTQRVEQDNIVGIDDQTVIWTDLTGVNAKIADTDDTQLFEIDPSIYKEPVLLDEAEIEQIELETQALSQQDINNVAMEVEAQSDDSLDETETQAPTDRSLAATSIEALDSDDTLAVVKTFESDDTLAVVKTFESDDTLAMVEAFETDETVAMVETFESDDTLAMAETFESDDTLLKVEAFANDDVNISAETIARETAEQARAMIELKHLRESLGEETRVRKELETHLRITRKGLAEMDSESRAFESQKALALTQLEQELEEKVKRTASAEARAEREAAKSASLENELVLSRQDTLKATKESRESVEARARALSTANKATTFARQAMDIRSRLESQIHDAEAELGNKQNTISSLIRALEKEKSRTQEQVASMAKQLILHEKQLHARRTLEEVSRSVDNKLTTRLVKKVAKSRS